MNCSI